MARIAQIYRYPVKGLSGESLERATVAAGEVIPFDRAYAIENGPSGFNPAVPEHITKIAFLMLMRNERLAELTTHFDERTAILSIRRGGKMIAEGCLDKEDGRQVIEAFVNKFEADELRGPVKVLHSPGFSFSDTRGPPKKVLSVINLESVRALSQHFGADVHPLRFRGNIYVEGLPAWEEFTWVGRRVVAGGIACEVTKRIDRCAAINVDPLTGVRDLNLIRGMMKDLGHIDCGIYMKVLEGGEFAVGEAINAGEFIAPAAELSPASSPAGPG